MSDMSYIDVGGGDNYIAGRLSNFTERHFIFDGFECASIEGVLQSFKFSDIEKQREVCLLVGIKAKKAGRKTDWRPSQILYWQGRQYPRHSTEYQDLLDRLYMEAYRQDHRFSVDLLATGQREFTHSIGLSDPRETILTEKEFCSRLENLRNLLRSESL